MNTVTYTRKDIVRRVSDNLGLGDNEVKVIIDVVLETMTGIFMEDHEVLRLELRNFGVFEVKPTKARTNARNPRTLELYRVPARRKLSFKPGKSIKIQLKKSNV